MKACGLVYEYGVTFSFICLVFLLPLSSLLSLTCWAWEHVSLSMVAHQGCENWHAGSHAHTQRTRWTLLHAFSTSIYCVHGHLRVSPRISERPLKRRLLLSALEVKCFQSALKKKRHLWEQRTHYNNHHAIISSTRALTLLTQPLLSPAFISRAYSLVFLCMWLAQIRFLIMQFNTHFLFGCAFLTDVRCLALWKGPRAGVSQLSLCQNLLRQKLSGRTQIHPHTPASAKLKIDPLGLRSISFFFPRFRPQFPFHISCYLSLCRAERLQLNYGGLQREEKYSQTNSRDNTSQDVGINTESWIWWMLYIK